MTNPQPVANQPDIQVARRAGNSTDNLKSSARREVDRRVGI